MSVEDEKDEPAWKGLARALGFEPGTGIKPLAGDIIKMERPHLPPLLVSPLPEHARRTAEGVDRMVELTELNVEIAKAAQKDADETKTFSKRMTWASLAISIVGVLIAVASLAVAIALH